jgi:hypothetical protein
VASLTKQEDENMQLEGSARDRRACFLADGGCTFGAATPLADKDLSKKNY